MQTLVLHSYNNIYKKIKIISVQILVFISVGEIDESEIFASIFFHLVLILHYRQLYNATLVSNVLNLASSFDLKTFADRNKCRAKEIKLEFLCGEIRSNEFRCNENL